METHQLAIVIPAYKAKYFRETLESISQQTCKDFTLYIGDDHSPENIYPIVQQFENDINIIYKRFDTNLGGSDLVAQWERCINLTQEEKWIWLFSDDDIMEPQCVEDFFNEIKNVDLLYDVYHFNTKIISSNSQIIQESKKYPTLLSPYNFYKKKLYNNIDSFVVEYIFSRETYNKNNKFEHFDLAWGTDTASWIKFANNLPIKTIENNSYILWRSSEINISPNKEKKVINRKLKALSQFFEWTFQYFKNQPHIKLHNYIFIISRLTQYSKYTDDQSIIYNFSTLIEKHYNKIWSSILFKTVFTIKRIKNIYVKKNI